MSRIEDVTDSPKDWEDFWYSPEKSGTWDYSKEQKREFELKEREYERKRAMLDAQYNKNEAKDGTI